MTEKKVVKLPHHEQEKLCETRAPYRQGRKLTAVKVYTINNESKHLIVSGVPKLQIREQLKKLFSPYGDIKRIYSLSEYPSELFEEAFHVHYARIQSARIAKHFVDGKNFFGGSLHVFYAPELETLNETREKLAQRRRDVTVRIERHRMDPTNPKMDPFLPKEQYDRKKKNPALPLTDERLCQQYPQENFNSIYEGIPKSIDPRPITEPSLPVNFQASTSSFQSSFQAPYQETENIFKSAGIVEDKIILDKDSRKRKNYKGRSIDSKIKNKIFKPQIVDTTLMTKKSEKIEKHFVNVKKVDSGIKIKILPKKEDEKEVKKRIVIKNPGSTILVKPSIDLKTCIQTAKDQIREAMQRHKS